MLSFICMFTYNFKLRMKCKYVTEVIVSHSSSLRSSSNIISRFHVLLTQTVKVEVSHFRGIFNEMRMEI
jgi:hypothetical protein